MTSYKEIFDLALRLYDDPSLATWPEEDLSNELYSHLQIAIANTPKIRSEVTDRDAFDPMLIDSTGFKNDLSDVTKMVLGLGMKRAWLQPQIASTTVTLQAFNKAEGYSQREHLRGLMSLDESIRIEIRKLLRDNSYVDNGYFDD